MPHLLKELAIDKGSGSLPEAVYAFGAWIRQLFYLLNKPLFKELIQHTSAGWKRGVIRFEQRFTLIKAFYDLNQSVQRYDECCC